MRNLKKIGNKKTLAGKMKALQQNSKGNNLEHILTDSANPDMIARNHFVGDHDFLKELASKRK